MTFINYASREINCKIVYYGPGLQKWGYCHGYYTAIITAIWGELYAPLRVNFSTLFKC